MANFMVLVKTYSVYVIAVAALVFNLGAVVGWWTIDNAIWLQADSILAFLGLGSIRAKLSDIFSGIDMGVVGVWLQGNRTYIVAILGSLFNILVAFGVVVPTAPIVIFINSVLSALGIGVFSAALSNYKAQALKLSMGTSAFFKKD